MGKEVDAVARLLIVDRIEGEYAVCEEPLGNRQDIPLSQLPEGLREGDCLWEEEGSYRLDREESARRRQKNRDLFQQLLKKKE